MWLVERNSLGMRLSSTGWLSKKCNIELQIDQSHSAKLPILLNAIGQFIFFSIEFCGQPTWNLQYRCT